MVCLDLDANIKFSEPVFIYFFGDLQFGASGFSAEAWKEFENTFRRTKNAYTVGLGDYGDFARPSIRVKMKESMQKDPSQMLELDDIVAPYYKKIGQMMEFMKGKILWLHDGHHNWKFQDGTTATQRLCRDLKTNYAEWMAYNGLHLKMNGEGLTQIVFLTMHGTGGAQMASTDARWLESRMWPGWEADIIARGHSTKLSTLEVPRNHRKRKGTPGFYSRSTHLLNCGGFCNGYTNGDGTSYVEMAGFLPSPLGWCVAKIEVKQLSPNQRKEDNNHSRQIRITTWKESYQEVQE